MTAVPGAANKFTVLLGTEPSRTLYVHGAQIPDHVNGADWFAVLGWVVSFGTYEFCIVPGPCLPKLVQLALSKLSQHETEVTAAHTAMLEKKEAATSTTVIIKCPHLGCPSDGWIVPKSLNARMHALTCPHNSCPGKDEREQHQAFVQSIPAAGKPTDAGFFATGDFTKVNYVETVLAPDVGTFSSEAECLSCLGPHQKRKHTCTKRSLKPDDWVQSDVYPFGTFVIQLDERHSFNASVVSDSMRELLMEGVFWIRVPNATGHQPFRF
jgi:hypothetical protein